MSAQPGKTASDSSQQTGITSITVAGFKSIRDEQTIEIRPLTILAGANSSGKSSMMQPLLLMKQTLEARFGDEALELSGPHVDLGAGEQMLWRGNLGATATELRAGICVGKTTKVVSRFGHRNGPHYDVIKTIIDITCDDHRYTREIVPKTEDVKQADADDATYRMWKGEREGPFLSPLRDYDDPPRPADSDSVRRCFLTQVADSIRSLIHLPGHRGGPERTHKRGLGSKRFRGPFPDYMASVIAEWEFGHHPFLLHELNEDLQRLALSSRATVRRITEAEVEVLVDRFPKDAPGRAPDLINLADVGFGVSKTLPLLVALHVATDEHLVYIEQPELHLHPRALVAMAEVLARAVKRGIRIVIETHSALLLLAVQSLVVEGKEGLTPDKVRLHWFSRSEQDGATTVNSADLDEDGSFGDWPEDFGDVELDIEKRYLDAVDARMSKG